MFFLSQELEKSDAQADEARKKAKGKQIGAVPKVSRAAPKAPRKNTKKATSAEAVEEITQTFDSAMDIGKLQKRLSFERRKKNNNHFG